MVVNFILQFSDGVHFHGLYRFEDESSNIRQVNEIYDHFRQFLSDCAANKTKFNYNSLVHPSIYAYLHQKKLQDPGIMYWVVVQ